MSVPMKSSEIEANNLYKMDQSLDCIPVRQSRSANNGKASVKESTFNINHTNLQYSYAIPEISISSSRDQMADLLKMKNIEAYKNSSVRQSNIHEVQKDTSKIEHKLMQQKLLQSLNAEQFGKRVHPCSFQIPTEESGASVDNENTENSLSISKIADYLGISF